MLLLWLRLRLRLRRPVTSLVELINLNVANIDAKNGGRPVHVGGGRRQEVAASIKGAPLSARGLR